MNTDYQLAAEIIANFYDITVQEAVTFYQDEVQSCLKMLAIKADALTLA